MHEEEVAIENWKGLLPSFDGNCCWVIHSNEDSQLGDGPRFPKAAPFIIGTQLSSMKLEFGEPSVYAGQP